MSKKILRYTGTFAAVLGLFWALLILTSLIPNGQIKKNLQKSEEFYKSAEAFSFEQGQKMHTVPIIMRMRSFNICFENF